jgi:alanyl-tRNA synthetase
MGLERLVRVLQGKTSNYDTDIFSGTIATTEKISGVRYDGSDTKTAVAFRVIADHIRAIGFTIADGQLPANTGAGYVIRRILRRAVRYYYSYLNYRQPLLTQLVPVLATQFQDVFPELHQQVDFVARVVREEEEAFLRTLEKGLRRIDDIVQSAKDGTIAGAAAFELYDTYGFPIDLTRLIASEHGLRVDEAGFELEMKQQKDRSRAATAVDAGDWKVLQEGSNQFVGYEQLETKAQLLKYRKVTAKGKEGYQWVLSATPFYAESGGQVGDTGWLHFGEQAVAVTDTKKDNDLIIHHTAEMPAVVTETVTASVNGVLRNQTAAHHTATHLLHAALRQVLGTHVVQKGSLVESAHLRFDFSHFAKVTADELLQIETIVNNKIRENIPVVIKNMAKDEALQLGAMALFGEKYGDKVRVVITDPSYSVELCGGTHVGATGQLGLFSLLSESAVAAGVRRVEAVCGQSAIDHIRDTAHTLQSLRELLKNPKDITKAVEQLQQEQTALRQRLEQFEQKEIVALRDRLLGQVKKIGSVHFIGEQVEVATPDALKKCCLELRAKATNQVTVLTALIDGKPFVAIGVAEELTKSSSLDANSIIKNIVAPLIKGGGGGQKTLATAGGQEASKLTEVIASVQALL